MPFTCGPYPFLLPGTRTQCPGLEQPPCNHEAECHTLGREGLEPNGFGPLRTALRGTDPTAVRPWASGLLQHRQLRLPEMAGSRLCSQGPAASLQRPPPKEAGAGHSGAPSSPSPEESRHSCSPRLPDRVLAHMGGCRVFSAGGSAGGSAVFKPPASLSHRSHLSQ